MKVNLGTLDVSDDMRRAIRAHYGKSGLATRAEVRITYRALADSDMEVILYEWETRKNEERDDDR